VRELVGDEVASTPQPPGNRRSVDLAQRDQVGGRKTLARRDPRAICNAGTIDFVQLEHADSRGALGDRGDSNARNAHVILNTRKRRAKLTPWLD